MNIFEISMLSIVVLAFVLLVIFLIILIVQAIKTLKSINRILSSVEGRQNEILNNIQGLSEDLLQKMQCLNPIFQSIANLGEGLEHKTHCFKECAQEKKDSTISNTAKMINCLAAFF